MEATARTVPIPKARLWAGAIVSALPAIFLLFDGVIKLAVIEPVVVSMTELGYPVGLAPFIGLLEIVCVALYVYPRTAVLGAVLLTGLLGGATASHLRIESPLFSHVLFPSYIGALLWGGLLLRDDRLRALFPVRSPRSTLQ